MIVVMSRIRVSSGDPDALAEQYRNRLRVAEDYPGCLGIEILRNNDSSDEFVVYSRWRDRDSYDAYRQSAAYREAHSRIAKIPGGIRIDPNSREVSIFEVLS